MRTLLLLAAVVSIAQPQCWIFGSSQTFFGDWSDFGCPFLRNASFKARMEFKKIIRDQKMTKGDREIALDDWADKHGLTKEYQKYKNATKTAREETRKSIKEALRNVQQFFEELEKIEDNQNQTYKEEKDQIRETCQALDSRGRRLVNCISNLYTVPVSYSGKQRRFSLFEDLFLDEPFLLSNPASKLKSLFSW